MDGGGGRVDRGRAHVYSVGRPKYLSVIVLIFPCDTHFKNSSIGRGVGLVGFARSPDILGSYWVYLQIAGATEAVVSFIEGFYLYGSVSRARR